MLKRDELADPKSCLNRSREDEMLFVVCERDIAAPETIRDWCGHRVRLGKNGKSDAQITEALECARYIQVAHLPETVLKKRIDAACIDLCELSGLLDKNGHPFHRVREVIRILSDGA
jgi:hypothetical protein